MEPKSEDQMYAEGQRHAEAQKEQFNALSPVERVNAMLAVAEGFPNKDVLKRMAGIEIDTLQDEATKQAIEQLFQSARIEKEGKTVYGFSPKEQKAVLDRLGPDVATAARRQITGYYRERLIKPSQGR